METFLNKDTFWAAYAYFKSCQANYKHDLQTLKEHSKHKSVRLHTCRALDERIPAISGGHLTNDVSQKLISPRASVSEGTINMAFRFLGILAQSSVSCRTFFLNFIIRWATSLGRVDGSTADVVGRKSLEHY